MPSVPSAKPSIPAQPRLDPSYAVRVVENGVVLLGERGYRWLDGDSYAALAPLLDGTREIPELVADARQGPGQPEPVDTLLTLALLAGAGLLVDGTAETSAGPASAARESLLDAARRLCRPASNRRPGELSPDPGSAAMPPRIALCSLGGESLDPRRISRLAARTNEPELVWIEPGQLARGQAELVIALVERLADIASPRSGPGRWPDESIPGGMPAWMPVQPTGRLPRMGPVFGPGRVCPACFVERLAPNRTLERSLGIEAPRPSTADSVDLVLELAILRARWFSARDPDPGRVPVSHLWQVDFDAETIVDHPVAASRDCSRCAGLASRTKPARGGLALVSRRRIPRADGGHRAVTNAETLRRLEPWTSPISGIVHADRHRRVGPESASFGVFVSAHGYPGTYTEWPRLRRRLRARCAGKGRTPEQARTSSLAEAVERYAAFHRPEDSVRVAPWEAIGSAAIHPRRCLLFSERQYRDRASSNARDAERNWVPRPFDETDPVAWTPAWSLRDGVERWLPTDYCYFDVKPAPSPYCRADSNGNAAGNSLEEAILQGFLELVERDAAALWWYSRARRPAADGLLSATDLPSADTASTGAASIGAASTDTASTGAASTGAAERHDRTVRLHDELRRALADGGRDLWWLDLTHDLGIPVVVAVSRSHERRAGDLLLGFGAHLDPALAAERALSELCQFLPAVPSGGAATAAMPSGAADAEKPVPEPMTTRLVDHPADGLDWLEPAFDARACPPRRDLEHEDLAREVEACVTLVAELGLDTLVLRQTRADTPLEVVKVLVPGLRPWWARFAPGRLYDVPPALGWVPAPLAEEQLNPVHLFL